MNSMLICSEKIQEMQSYLSFCMKKKTRIKILGNVCVKYPNADVSGLGYESSIITFIVNGASFSAFLYF